MLLAELMQLDTSAIETFDDAQHGSAAAASASAAVGSDVGEEEEEEEEEEDDDDDDDDDVSGGGGGGYGKGKGKGKAKRGPVKKKARRGGKPSSSAATDMDPDDDGGGGKLSPEELRQQQQQEQEEQTAASAAAAAVSLAGATASAISLPPVGFAPTADEESLRAIRRPRRPVGRDHRLPSLDPDFLGHVQAMDKVWMGSRIGWVGGWKCIGPLCRLVRAQRTTNRHVSTTAARYHHPTHPGALGQDGSHPRGHDGHAQGRPGGQVRRLQPGNGNRKGWSYY